MGSTKFFIVNMVCFLQVFLTGGSYILFVICWPGQGNEKGVPTTVDVAIDSGVQAFTFKQLHAATSGFSKDSVIGHGESL